MSELSIPTVIENTKQLLGGVRQSLVKVAANLYFLRSTGSYDKFGEYVEQEFGLSQSMTSKLISLYEGWVIKAGVPQERIENTDYEKLYGYLPLLENKDPEQALAEVTTWSRSDIRAERQEKAPHAFEPLTICKVCNGTEANHS